MSLVPDNPDLPEEYLCEIGRIAVRWSRLENDLNHTLIIALVGGFTYDGRPIAVFAHMAFQQKLDVLNTMLRIIDDNLATAYREQVQRFIAEAQQKRNATLHQNWSSYADVVSRVNISARGKLSITMTSVSLQELKDAVRSIDDAWSKLLMVVTFPLVSRFELQQGQ